MYGGRGFNPQMAMYGGQRAQMPRGGWNPQGMPQTPMMAGPGGFRQPMYNPMNPMQMQGMRPDFPQGGQRRQGSGPQGGAPPSQQSARQPQQPPAAQPAHQGTRSPDHNQPLTSEMLSQANASQQKQMIGERIFPKIQHREPKRAGKITGMLLEMDNLELLHLLDDENALMNKINEALQVLNSHSNDGPPEVAAE